METPSLRQMYNQGQEFKEVSQHLDNRAALAQQAQQYGLDLGQAELQRPVVSSQNLPAAIAGLTKANVAQWLNTASDAQRDRFLNQPVVRTSNISGNPLLDAPSSSLSSLVECITSDIVPELERSANGEFNGKSPPVESEPPAQEKYPLFPTHNLHDFK